MNTTDGNIYVINNVCNAGCTICSGKETYALNTCTQSVSNPLAFVLLTTTLCTGGLDSGNNAVGAVFSIFNNATCAASSFALSFNFGTNDTCIPFLGGTWGQLTPNGDGNFTAALYCTNSSCDDCVYVPNASGCLAAGAGATWNVQSLGALSTCAVGSSSSKLSTGAIIGIAVGGSVGVIAAIAIGTYMVKSKRRTGYTGMS